jgi:hypothetical protein
MKVYILSGYTGPGGSTQAFIMLTNALNNVGIETIFIGPHDYPMDKCKFTNNMGETLQLLTPEDILITHFLTINQRPPVKRLIFVSHETYWSELYNLPEFFDEVVFLHEKHRIYHEGYVGEYSIIPNLKPDLIFKDKKDKDLVAGIIGSIEDRKQTAVSISRALNDGCEKIYLFGNVNDEEYWLKSIVDWLVEFPETIELKGYIENKQEMYDVIGRVYHSSKGEVACLVKDECYLTGTQFFGNEQTDNQVSTLENDEVLQLWIKLFNK